MKKSSPPVTVSKLSNKVNYTLSLANLINIINWLNLNIIKMDLWKGFTLIYLLMMLAGLGRIVGVI